MEDGRHDRILVRRLEESPAHLRRERFEGLRLGLLGGLWQDNVDRRIPPQKLILHSLVEDLLEGVPDALHGAVGRLLLFAHGVELALDHGLCDLTQLHFAKQGDEMCVTMLLYQAQVAVLRQLGRLTSSSQ